MDTGTSDEALYATIETYLGIAQNELNELMRTGLKELAFEDGIFPYQLLNLYTIFSAVIQYGIKSSLCIHLKNVFKSYRILSLFRF